MAIQVYTLGEGPRATRNKRKALENSEEWLMLKSKFAEGIKPFEEVIVTFTAQDRAKLRIKGPKRVFRDMANDWIRKAKLPYSVDAYTSEGNDVIKISNSPVITKNVGAKEITNAGSAAVARSTTSQTTHKKRRA